MKVTLVAGARPNFMKIAPIIEAIRNAKEGGADIHFRLVHTGQHYDNKMSGNFFKELNIPEPDVNLGCGSGTQAQQTAAIMISFEEDLQANPTDLVMFVGDVTSTMACAITAKKLCIDVAHVEAGIRSGDMTMPEEINRIVTDSICDHFFTTTEEANVHLRKMGIQDHQIHLVGNTMIDTLNANLDKLKKPKVWDQIGLKEKKYFLLTLHRPSNVDHPANLMEIFGAIKEATNGYEVVFPMHPRTRKNIEKFGISLSGISVIDPLGYHEFIYLVKHAKGIITDSGGITEEATVLNIPCLTLRNSTERPETVTMGTNELIGDNLDKLKSSINLILNGNWKKGTIPVLWDGKTSERIVQTVLKHYQK